jgi:hypothetical protein
LKGDGQPFGEVPGWARTEFIKRIQPMMVHSCATAGCHQPDTPRHLQIDRLALDGVGNPELIHRNLASTVAMLDLAEPEASRLISMGTTAHGRGRKQSRPLSPHQLEILRVWITQIALNEPPRETSDESPVPQIVVGMSNGPRRKSTLDTTRAVPASDPFDPTEFNRSDEATDAPTSTNITQPSEDPATEPAQ